MTEVFTYRISTEDTWQYEFYKNGERFGGASFNITPSKPALMEGPGLKWSSPFDFESEIIPIENRIVLNSETGKEVYRIVFWQPGLYELRSKEKSVQVMIRNGNYLFGAPGKPMTAMMERTKGKAIRIHEKKTEAWFRTVFFVPASPRYMLMTLTFPALRFC